MGRPLCPDTFGEQFIGAAAIGASRVVFSTFWIDHAGTVRSGLAFFKKNHGTYEHEELVPSPPLYDLAAGPGGTFAGILFDAHEAASDGLPLLAVFDATGREITRGAHVLPGTKPHEAAGHAVHARLAAVGNERYVLFDARSQKLHELVVRATRPGRNDQAERISVTVEKTSDLTAYGSGKVLSILGFPSGSILAVVRSEQHPGKRLIELSAEQPAAVHELPVKTNHVWVTAKGEIGYIQSSRTPVFGRAALP